MKDEGGTDSLPPSSFRLPKIGYAWFPRNQDGRRKDEGRGIVHPSAIILPPSESRVGKGARERSPQEGKKGAPAGSWQWTALNLVTTAGSYRRSGRSRGNHLEAGAPCNGPREAFSRSVMRGQSRVVPERRCRDRGHRTSHSSDALPATWGSLPGGQLASLIDLARGQGGVALTGVIIGRVAPSLEPAPAGIA